MAEIKESEEAARRRCFVKGKIVGEDLSKLHNEMRLLETSPRWPSIMSPEKKAEFELETLEGIERDVNQAFTGYPDGLPRCFSPRQMACWRPTVEAVRDSIESKDWGEAAKGIKFGMEECLVFGMLGVTIVSDIAELEYILKKRLKGEPLPFEREE